MPIFRNTLIRPNTEIQFFSYDNPEYFALIKSRHEYDAHMTMSQDGLTKVVEMTFATIEQYDAWKNDSDRIAMSNLTREYNGQNGILAIDELFVS